MLTNIPADRWYQAIHIRRSRRKYSGQPLSPELTQQLMTLCHSLSEQISGVRAVTVTEKPEAVFKGIIGSYGKIKGAPAYIAFIGNTTDLQVNEKIGYLGEAIILEATMLGLGTCWVGGFFKREVVEAQIPLSKEDKVFCITPVGYCDEGASLEEKTVSGFAPGHKRKPLSSLCPGTNTSSFEPWLQKALEAARLAPSAVNRQPWRFYIEPDGISIGVDSSFLELGIAKRLDCGIAMLHLEVATLAQGVAGQWEPLTPPLVAKYHPVV